MQIIDGRRYPTVTTEGVYGFFAEYRWLSNFHLCEIALQGLKYPSSEHAYQAMKTIRTMHRKMVRDAATPALAKKIGQEVPLRPDWETIRVKKMYEVLRCKFLQHDYLRIFLERTGDKHLEEANDWGDDFWGTCNGKGQNKLGKILMRLRSEFRE
jgi:hypothetical protein